MLYAEKTAFEKAFLNDSFTTCFLAESGLLAVVLKKWKDDPLVFDSETFSLDRFKEEALTMPLLSRAKVLMVKEVEKLSSDDLEGISTCLERQIPWLRLLLLGTLPSTHKFIKKIATQGIVFCPKEEKAWEKEKRLSSELTDHAKKEGVNFPTSLTLDFVRRVGPNEVVLKSELEKLLLYIGDRKEITASDIRAISIHLPGETVWQLGDALFALDRPTLLRIGKQLFEEERSLFALLASLRHIHSSGLKMLQCYETGGANAVAKEFPYLKGAWLEKKIQSASHYGMNRLKNGLTLLFEMEVEAKSSTSDEALLLDILLVKLSRR